MFTYIPWTKSKPSEQIYIYLTQSTYTEMEFDIKNFYFKQTKNWKTNKY